MTNFSSFQLLYNQKKQLKVKYHMDKNDFEIYQRGNTCVHN